MLNSIKVRIIVTAVAMAMLISVMSFGVWAASSQNSGISATISFTPSDINCQIVGDVTNAYNSSGEAISPTFNVTVISTDESVPDFGIPNLYFKEAQNITIRIAIRNTGNINMFVKPTSTTTPAGVTVSYKQIPHANLPTSSSAITSSNISAYSVLAESVTYANLGDNSGVATYSIYYVEITYSIDDWGTSLASSVIALNLSLKSSVFV